MRIAATHEHPLGVPYRACVLCKHGKDVDGSRCCVSPACTQASRPIPVHIVRSPNGACGGEARHLDFLGLH
jgi:hypothetical protein